MKKFTSGPKIHVPGAIASEARIASVLIALCVDKQKQEVSLLYTIRSSNLKRHVGEVSFPGGVKDETDADVIECALRETEEEIGIPRASVKVWGVGQAMLPYNRFLIHPVVAVIEDFDQVRPAIRLDPAEVEDYFLVPLEHLCSSENQEFTYARDGYSVPAFLNGKAKVWGITGLMTHVFLTALFPRDVYKFDVPAFKKTKL